MFACSIAEPHGTWVTLALSHTNQPNTTVTLLTLTQVNDNVHSVHLPDGSHVGNLKRIGTVWKFKAVGYDAQGGVEPGGGPLTDRHNTEFARPDAAEVSTKMAV
jgi:hypothetical protein